MKLKLLIVICALAAVVSAQQQVKIRAGGPPDAEMTKDWPRAAEGMAGFQKFVDEMTERDLFSGTILIMRGDVTLFSKSYGFADKEHSVRNTAETKFNLGSINKVFTRIALLQLRHAGKIDFSKTLRTYWPDYPSPVADKITIQQILDMSSGLGDFFGPKYAAASKENIRSLADYMPFFVDEPLEFEPGTKRRYSNAGYVVLGQVIERISGMSYYDYVRANIFTPAGMKDTDSYEVDAIVQNRAIGYTGPKHGRANVYQLPARGSSAGGGFSTAGDLLRFTRALPQLLSPEDYRGFIGNPPGAGFGGGAPGLNAALEMEGDTTIIVLANYDPPAAEYVAMQARRALGVRVDD